MILLFGTAPMWPYLALLACWLVYWLACMEIHSRERP